MADHYEVLQVSPRAEPEVIRAAFRALARKYHPDFGGDPRLMMKLNEAWNVLGDRQRRAAYDASRVGSRSRLAGGVPHQRRPTSSSPEPTPVPSNPNTAPDRPGELAAEPPPAGRQAGTVLDFGRYAGWSVGALAGHDPDYLLWLERTPIGRPLRTEIGGFMEGRRAAAGTNVGPAARARRGGLLSRQRAG
jgi:curved DNA-binding protein CbpA